MSEQRRDESSGPGAVHLDDRIFEVTGLRKDFEIRKPLTRKHLGTVRAVNDISFYVRRGETLGFVGESGCGKTTAGRCLVRGIEPSAGKIIYRPDGKRDVDVRQADRSGLKKLRKEVRMVFQDPYSSLNPRMNVFQIVAEPLIVNRIVRFRPELEARVGEILERVGLDPQYMHRFPHAFSGGQRQRIAVARALIPRPKFVIADEPVSALDVSIQAQILNLLEQLKTEFSLTYLFVAHNLAVVQHVSDRVAVMYMGRIMELGQTDELYTSPINPYTEALLSAVPVADPEYQHERITLTGEVGSLLHPPTGCFFHPRCPYAERVCRETSPELLNYRVEDQDPHYSACHFSDTLGLRGVTG